MAITDAYVLPEDLIILPVSELDPEIRARVHSEDGDFAVTRPRARTPTKIIDAQLGELLSQFTRSRKIIDAIVEFSSVHALDPEQVLLDAFPVIQKFIDGGLLVEETSPRAKRIAAMMAAGDRVGEWEIVICRQVLEDVELYQVRSADRRLGALKLARRDSSGIREMFDAERESLALLAGSVSPALMASGSFDGRAYLVMEWCSGVDAGTVASELRVSSAPEDRVRLLTLCGDIAGTYAEMHQRGVLQGDIHERNVLVDAQGAVRILDFGLAKIAQLGRSQRHRGGFSIYVEPEYARAHLAGRHAPTCTAAGEQYSIAALIYSLYTGTTYLNFSPDLSEAWRQSAEELPLPFVKRGLAPFPELEQVLARALQKDPESRFASVADFARALGEVRNGESLARMTALSGTEQDRSLPQDLLNSVLRDTGWDGSVFRRGVTDSPRASVTFGAAGIAYALYRIALLREDPDLLALADVWATRARSCARRRSAFYNARLGLTPDSIGPSSLYHTLSGVHVVRALIARAMGDLVSMRESTELFIRSASRRPDNLDLTLGRSGLLLGSALLLEAMPQHPLVERAPLLTLGDRLLGEIWSEMEPQLPIGARGRFASLGIAHGWGGILYAAMRWQTARGAPPLATLELRLRQLAECAESFGRGLRWPWRDVAGSGERKDTYMAGWCNGSAGFVHLWLLAASVFGDAAFVELARGAAWNVWEGDTMQALDLCCGLSGRSYALLALYRQTGEIEWLRRGRTLAAEAAEIESSGGEHGQPYGLTSLYKGQLGTALLIAEIERPELARMPMFEAEGWPLCPA
jgi:serine/threonine-protein kinase